MCFDGGVFKGSFIFVSMSRHKLDINNWARKSHFEFFTQFDEPFFGVCVEIDCTKAYHRSKEKGYSFFLYYLHKSLIVANQTEPFCYRIEDSDVYKYDKINASPTINRPDGTFGFSYIAYHADFELFQVEAQKEIEKVKQSKGLFPAISGENVIHYSSLPWIKFTSISHARNYSFNDSCPKISFGKMTQQNSRTLMPVSVHVHHALVDGSHVGQYINAFQDLMNIE